MVNFYVTDNVAVIKLSNKAGKVNCYSKQFAMDITRVIDYLDENKTTLAGAILISDKKDNFFAGADLKNFKEHTLETMKIMSTAAQSNIR